MKTYRIEFVFKTSSDLVTSHMCAEFNALNDEVALRRVSIVCGEEQRRRNRGVAKGLHVRVEPRYLSRIVQPEITTNIPLSQ
jgi:hypothetical protein